jgi:hypothetical protein
LDTGCVSNFTRRSKNFLDLSNSLDDYCSNVQRTFICKISRTTSQVHQCSHLTSIMISRFDAKKLKIDKVYDKILVKFKLASSPLIKYRNKDVTKRVLSLVESTYGHDYLARAEGANTFYAILNITDHMPVHKSTTCKVEMSDFLFKQSDLTIHSKIQITTVNKEEIRDKLSNSFTLKVSSSDVSGSYIYVVLN